MTRPALPQYQALFSTLPTSSFFLLFVQNPGQWTNIYSPCFGFCRYGHSKPPVLNTFLSKVLSVNLNENSIGYWMQTAYEKTSKIHGNMPIPFSSISHNPIEVPSAAVSLNQHNLHGKLDIPILYMRNGREFRKIMQLFQCLLDKWYMTQNQRFHGKKKKDEKIRIYVTYTYKSIKDQTLNYSPPYRITVFNIYELESCLAFHWER